MSHYLERLADEVHECDESQKQEMIRMYEELENIRRLKGLCNYLVDNFIEEE